MFGSVTLIWLFAFFVNGSWQNKLYLLHDSNIGLKMPYINK